MRVLITGMGGELGTRVAQLLEADDAIEAVAGIDLDPPRRRLHRAEYHRVEPRDPTRTAAVVRAFAPTAVMHVGTYEPNARSGPRSSVARTARGTIGVLDAAVAAGTLERIVMRSGIEVYGRSRAVPDRPDERVAPRPTTAWGHSLAHAERIAQDAGARAGAPVAVVRAAPIVGPHFPSPLGRLLRLPAVPVSPVRDPVFSVLHQADAADALVAALASGHDGPVNVVGPGVVTVSQAAKLGGRVPVPVLGPCWRPVHLVAEIAGAPVPDHVHELLTRGRTADGSAAATTIAFTPRHRTPEVIAALHEWAEVSYLTPAPAAA